MMQTRRLALYVGVGVTSSLLTWFVWGSVSPVPAIHDELAYELQCQIFATGAWTVPTPPSPDFFQQFYVLDEPAVASKYWPVHSLLMSPGCALSLPVLVPILFAGVCGALVLALALQFTTLRWALVIWLLWLTCPVSLEFRASYLSQASTTPLFLAALLFFERWHRRPSHVTLVGFGICSALCLGARPLTGVALTAPLALLLAWRLLRIGRLRDAWWFVVSVLATLLVIPLWSYQTVGRIDSTPYAEYARQFFPFDKPGFHFDDRQPSRTLPPDMVEHGRSLGAFFAQHTVERVPRIALERALALGRALFGGWRLVLLPFFLLGLWTGRRTAGPLVAFSCSATLFLTYLVFAHPPAWTLYYVEVFPLVYFIVGIGLSRAASMAPRTWRLDRDPALIGGATVLLMVCAGADVRQAWVHRARWQAHVTPAIEAIAAINQPAIVFVRYQPGWNLAFGLVHHAVDWREANVWVVRDLGKRNAELLALSEGRVIYRYETAKGVLAHCRVVGALPREVEIRCE